MLTPYKQHSFLKPMFQSFTSRIPCRETLTGSNSRPVDLGAHELNNNNNKEEVASETSERSRKSDAATNTEEAATNTAAMTATNTLAATCTATSAAREQDPYRACRKLPLPRQETCPVLLSCSCSPVRS